MSENIERASLSIITDQLKSIPFLSCSQQEAYDNPAFGSEAEEVVFTSAQPAASRTQVAMETHVKRYTMCTAQWQRIMILHSESLKMGRSDNSGLEYVSENM